MIAGRLKDLCDQAANTPSGLLEFADVQKMNSEAPVFECFPGYFTQGIARCPAEKQITLGGCYAVSCEGVLFSLVEDQDLSR